MFCSCSYVYPSPFRFNPFVFHCCSVLVPFVFQYVLLGLRSCSVCSGVVNSWENVCSVIVRCLSVCVPLLFCASPFVFRYCSVLVRLCSVCVPHCPALCARCYVCVSLLFRLCSVLYRMRSLLARHVPFAPRGCPACVCMPSVTKPKVFVVRNTTQ